MTVPSPRKPGPLRGFWLLSVAVALASLAVGSTIVRAELQLDRVELWLDEGLEAPRARADEALASWGEAWLDTWLRRQGQSPDQAEALRSCMKDWIYALDQVSVSANVVRFGAIEQARGAAERCVAEQVEGHHARAFVHQLQRRWASFLEQRGEAAPQLGGGPPGERRGDHGKGDQGKGKGKPDPNAPGHKRGPPPGKAAPR